MATQTHQKNILTLEDENSFEFLSGLWTGKKPPFTKAVVIRNTNFSNDGKIDYSNIAVLDVEAKQLHTRKLQKGDIIIERSGGGPKQPVGRVVYFDKETQDISYSFSNFTSAIRVKNKSNFDSMYVFYFLYNFYAEGNTDHLQRRTTGIRNLDFSSYKESVVFPLISIAEQKAIARALTTVQNSITEQEKLITKLKELKRSMMRHLFTRGTKWEKTKLTEIGEMPEGWEVKRLGDVVDISSGGTPSRKNLEYWTGGTIPWVKTTEINYAPISYTEEKITGLGLRNSSAKLFPKGTLLMAMYGQGVTRGRVAILNIEASTNQACSAFLGDEETNKYLYYFLTYSYESIRQLGHGANQKNLNASLIKAIGIPVCDVREMQKIVSTLEAIDANASVAEEQLQTYRGLLKTLLHELMSGERRIKNI